MSIFQRILLITFGSLLGLGLFEITARICAPLLQAKGSQFESIAELRQAITSPGMLEKTSGTSSETGSISLKGIVDPDQSDRIIYRLKPNLDLRFVRARVKTNSCGFRSPEISIRKPSKTIRVGVIGDSFAFGWGVEQDQGFPQILENKLNGLAPDGFSVQVINMGVPGYSSFQEVALLAQYGLQFSLDAVLIFFVQNDFGMPFFIRDLEGKGGLLSSLEFVRLGKRLLSGEQMDQKINQLGLDPNRALKDFSKLSSEHGFKPFFAINPHKKWRQDIKKLWALNREPAIKQISLHEPLNRLIKDQNINIADLTLSFDPHPSPIRHKFLGEILAAGMQEVLR